ncbi:hypothetical protein PLICRDRAFT_92732 [Plicaturopsis crispa FD-325 SS-3]|nr:hypothetical protein PLICRDRAFT_92732 [Plicaturopsis crispa FD-325 SS-3]
MRVSVFASMVLFSPWFGVFANSFDRHHLHHASSILHLLLRFTCQWPGYIIVTLRPFRHKPAVSGTRLPTGIYRVALPPAELLGCCSHCRLDDYSILVGCGDATMVPVQMPPSWP